MAYKFIGTNEYSIENPNTVKTTNLSITGQIENPSSFMDRMHFPWTESPSDDINLPSTIITLRILFFKFDKVIVEILNTLEFVTTISDKLERVYESFAFIFTNDESDKSKRKNIRRASIYSEIHEKIKEAEENGVD